MYASQKGNAECVNELIKAGASIEDVDEVNECSMTATVIS